MIKNFSSQQVKEIEQIVKSYISRTPFKYPKIPPHKHNGVDNLNIEQQDIVSKPINTGTIDFTRATDYNIEVNFTPKSIYLYGIITNNDGISPIKGILVGNALLNGAFYSAPSTTSSVKVATSIQEVAQSSVYYLDVTGGTFHTLASQTHIVRVNYGGHTYASITVQPFKGNGITLTVDAIESGWTVSVNLVIT